MKDNGNKSQAARRVRALLVGAAAGLLLGIGASFITSPDEGPPGYVEVVDRWGMIRTLRVDKWPPYVVLPIVGAIACVSWSEVRHVFRRK
jgi:hypothetical protein